jgi:hypothetical protein
MGNLFFPQLLTGAVAQYPVRKVKQFRTVLNTYGDGSVVAYPDSGASRLAWQLKYSGISAAELTALQTLFAQCSGPLMPFTFIDPTDNMLASSSDLRAAAWTADPGVSCTSGSADPVGGQSAFALANLSQAAGGIGQALQVPGNYQYCFSIYVRSDHAVSLALERSAGSVSQVQQHAISTNWTRLVSAGRLVDSGSHLTISLLLNPGDQVQVFGPQLEAQCSPSGYRPTTARGGVYPKCHWTNAVLPMTAQGPNVFATECGIETLL